MYFNNEFVKSVFIAAFCVQTFGNNFLFVFLIFIRKWHNLSLVLFRSELVKKCRENDNSSVMKNVANY